MENVSVISYNDDEQKMCRRYAAGHEVTYIYSPRSRRKLRRLLSSSRTEAAAVLGDAPDFVEDVLKKAEISVCTGEKLLGCVYPQLISRSAKMDGKCAWCTVYDEVGDEKTLDIIKCASQYFRYVSLCTSSPDASNIAEKIMDMTGLALSFGEGDGVGIVRTGCGGAQKIKIDLTAKSKTLFCDANRNIIPPSLAEALAGDNIDNAVLSRLNLKIHSLC